MIDYTKLHWYSDNEEYSVYSVTQSPHILLYIKEDELVGIEYIHIK